MAKKGGGSDTVQVENRPPIFAGDARNTINWLQQYTEGNLDDPLHPLQERGLRGMEREALQGGQLVPGATGYLEDLFRGGGLDPRAERLARGLVTGHSDFINPAMRETRRIAMGGDVGTNPYLEATYERAARPLLENLTETVNPSIDIGAASSGRLGGGMHALLRNKAGEQTGQALTDLATGIYGGAYEADQGRRMAALGQYAGLGQQAVANRIAGAGIMDTGTARTLAASGLAPGLDAARYADAQQLYNIGQTRQQAPYQIADPYARFLGSIPNTTGGYTEMGPGGESPWAGAFSGALGGGALGLGLTGLKGWGMVGGGLGALAGLLSDERAKEDVEPVGITFAGTPLYKYRYREEYGGGPAHVGALAQDVLELQPDAVTVMPEGLLGIDYSRLR